MDYTATRCVRCGTDARRDYMRQWHALNRAPITPGPTRVDFTEAQIDRRFRDAFWAARPWGLTLKREAERRAA